MQQPTKEELLASADGSIDTDALTFTGLRGDAAQHLSRAALITALAELPPPPRDEGRVDLLVARGEHGERQLPREALLTVAGGMPADRWADTRADDPDSQLATTCTPVARTIANGQPLELHGDNLYLDLDLTPSNLPPGSLVRAGEAELCVTPKPHNGCKKWVQRFGLPAMKLNLDPAHRDRRLRGIYLRVVTPGVVRVGDRVHVVRRAN